MSPPGAWWIACVVAEVAALAGAVRVARSVVAGGKTGNPLVALLAFALVADVGVQLLAPLAASGPRPRHGLPLLAFHAANALVTACPLVLGWASWRAFRDTVASNPGGLPIPFAGSVTGDGMRGLAVSPLPIRPRKQTRQQGSMRHSDHSTLAALSSWVALQVGLVVAHPIPRARLAGILLGWHVAGVVFAAAPIVLAWGKAPRTVAHHVVGLLVAVSLAVVCCGPFVGDAWSDWASTATPAWALGFSLAAGLLWRRGRRST